MLPKKKGWQARAPRRHSQQHCFNAVPAPGHPHRKTSPLPEGAGGCGRVPSELGGEATSGGESRPAAASGAAEHAACPARTRSYEPSHPHTVTALCLPVCCLFHPPFTEFPTRSEPCHKQRQAETPSLPQEVSSLKFRRVTEQQGSSGGKTGIITRSLLAAQLSRSGHLQA